MPKKGKKDSKEAMIQKILCRINDACASESANNTTYKENIRFFYECSMSPDDQAMLAEYEKTQLTFNILESIVNQYVRQITDSSPSITVESIDQSDDMMLAYSEHLNEEIEKVLKKNKYTLCLAKASQQAIVGGKAIIKLSTDYINNKSLDQKVVFSVLDDPTTVYFSPTSKKVDRSDSTYVVEELGLTKEEIETKFPDADLSTKMFTTGGAEKLKWKSSQTGEDVYTLFNFYEYQKKKSKIYLLSDSSIVSEEPANKDMVESERTVEDCSVICRTLLGKQVINEEVLNTETLPFFQITGKQYTDGTNLYVKSFIDSAVDAQRAKNLIANQFFSEAFSLHKSTFFFPVEQYLKETADCLAKPNQKSTVFYKSLVEDGTGNVIQMGPPTVTPPATIPPEYMQMYMNLDGTIKDILGAYQTTANQNNMSGVALYNLSQYTSGMMTPFMNNLLVSLENMTLCMLSMFKKIYSSNTIQKGDMQMQFDYEYDVREFETYVRPGVDFKLQQEATLERMIKLSQVSPNFAQWLNSEGIPLVLENMDLNEKSKITESYDKFIQQQQTQAAQQPPSPDQIMAQSKLLEAQTKAKELQLKEQELGAKTENANSKVLLDMHKLRNDRKESSQDRLLDLAKLQSENYRTLVQNKKEE